MWKFDNKLPIHSQIADKILRDLASGRLKSSERMPSVRELAEEAGVNPNTMQRALQTLEDRGYLKSDRTVGRYVSAGEEDVVKLRKELVDELCRRTLAELEALGYTKNDFINFLKEKGETLDV